MFSVMGFLNPFYLEDFSELHQIHPERSQLPLCPLMHVCVEGWGGCQNTWLSRKKKHPFSDTSLTKEPISCPSHRAGLFSSDSHTAFIFLYKDISPQSAATLWCGWGGEGDHRMFSLLLMYHSNINTTR